jgi:hypothetical protein
MSDFEGILQCLFAVCMVTIVLKNSFKFLIFFSSIGDLVGVLVDAFDLNAP